MKFAFLYVTVFLAGCGYRLAPEENFVPTEEIDDAPEDQGPAPEIGFECPEGFVVQEGDNVEWNIDGISRSFHADFPEEFDASGGLGVLFTWHGVGDNVTNWRNFVGFNPDADPEFPFVVITPVSTQMSPLAAPQGLDWDIFQSQSGDDNREAKLFESILGCLDHQVELNTRRIYTGGFSGGALVSAMLYSRYPDLIAAAAVLSGAFLNDPQQLVTVDTGPISVAIQWDPLEVGSKAPVLLSRGGGNDTYSALGIRVIDFEATMVASKTYLTGAGRGVIDCAHQAGHTWPPGLTVEAVIAFFKAHPFGSEALFAGAGLPANLAMACEEVPSSE